MSTHEPEPSDYIITGNQIRRGLYRLGGRVWAEWELLIVQRRCDGVLCVVPRVAWTGWVDRVYKANLNQS